MYTLYVSKLVNYIVLLKKFQRYRLPTRGALNTFLLKYSGKIKALS